VTWPTDRIRELVGRPGLHKGTLNVRLSAEHQVTANYTLPEEQNNRLETLYFERCNLLIRASVIPALIARTSTNHHGSDLLEIMADVHIRQTFEIPDGARISVEVEN
jgi:CTP-dependent riboflavin kinase